RSGREQVGRGSSTRAASVALGTTSLAATDSVPWRGLHSEVSSRHPVVESTTVMPPTKTRRAEAKRKDAAGGRHPTSLRLPRELLARAQRYAQTRHVLLASALRTLDRKSTRLNSSHGSISYAVF